LDNRINNGGQREGSGRKSKEYELQLLERLSPLDDDAFEALEQGIKEGKPQFVKLFFEYRYGKPLQRIEETREKKSITIIDWLDAYNEGDDTITIGVEEYNKYKDWQKNRK
jgi:hypothetical protein